MEKPKSKPEHMLMEAIGFTDEDLEANRERYMSQRQRALLDNDRVFWNVVVIIELGIGLALAVTCSALSGPTITLTIRNLVIASLMIAALVFFSRRSWRRFNDDLQRGEVAAVEGRVKLDVANQGRRGYAYALAVDDTEFGVKKDVFLAFKNGDPYRIYYAPHSKTLLSAEWLREEPPDVEPPDDQPE